MRQHHNIRRMIAEDGFANLVDGKVVAIPHSEKLIRALALAAEYGFLELIQELVQEGADLNKAGRALITAADSERVEVLKYLITAGVPVNARCEMFGATALMYAAGSGAATSVKVLLDVGADRYAVDGESRTAGGWAEMGFYSWEAMGLPPELNAGYREIFAALAK